LEIGAAAIDAMAPQALSDSPIEPQASPSWRTETAIPTEDCPADPSASVVQDWPEAVMQPVLPIEVTGTGLTTHEESSAASSSRDRPVSLPESSEVALPTEIDPRIQNDLVEESKVLPPPVEIPGETDLLSQAWLSAISDPKTPEIPVALAAAPAVTDAPPGTDVESIDITAKANEETAVETGFSPQDRSESIDDTASDIMRDIEEELFLPLTETAPSDKPMERHSSVLLAEPAATPMPAAEGDNPFALPPGPSMSKRVEPPPVDAIERRPEFFVRPIVKPMPRPVPNDPLAALKAMTDEERIAVFT
jgi:hypothetical protein